MMIDTHPRLYRLIVILIVLAGLACAWLWPLPLRAEAPPDPRITAVWDSSSSATIQWTQQQRGCLSVEHATGERVFIECRETPGTQVLLLGHGLTDGTARPAAGDRYVIRTQGQTFRAQLVGRAVYLPAFRA
jgi:hypothetical protein